MLTLLLGVEKTPGNSEDHYTKITAINVQNDVFIPHIPVYFICIPIFIVYLYMYT